MAEAKSHPLLSHAQPGQEKKHTKKRRIWRGRRQRHGWIAVGMRMSIFELTPAVFSVFFLGVENPHPLPGPARPYRAGHLREM